ncbi:MAG: TIR domain-containing protein [Vicinamibacterales bacterium]
MPDVFISYSRRNADLADALVAWLEAAGLDVWIDRQDIPEGMRWRDELSWAIEGADSVVLVLTPAAADSPYVAEEIVFAGECRKPVLPLIHWPTDSRPRFPGTSGDLQGVVLGDDHSHAFTRVLAALRKDAAWKRQQSELLRRARDWEAGKGDLLPEVALARAEHWQSLAGVGDRVVPDLVSRYIAESRQGQQRAREAKANDLARIVLSDREPPVTGLLLAIAAVEQCAPTPEAEHALHHAVARSQERRVAHAGGPVDALAAGAGGQGWAAVRGAGLCRWRIGTGELEAPLAANGSVTALAWSPRSGRVAIGTHEGRVGLAGPEEVPIWLPHGMDAGIASIACHPDGRHLAVGTRGGRLAILQAADDGDGAGTVVASVQAGGDVVRTLDWAPDGSRLLAAIDSGPVAIWAPGSGAAPHAFRDGSFVARWAPDGARFFAGGLVDPLVYDAATLRPLRELAPSTHIRSAAWSARGDRLATGGGDGSVRVWDPDRGRELAGLGRHDPAGRRADVSALAWLPGDRAIVSGGADGTLRTWDPDPDGARRVPAGRAWSAAWAPDGTAMAMVDPGGLDVIVRDLAGLDERARLRRDGAEVQHLAWSAEGRWLLVASDCGVEAWTGDPWRLAGTLPLAGRLWSVACAPDGRRVALGLDHGAVEVWSLDDRTRSSVVRDPAGAAIRDLAWSPCGRRLALARDDEGAGLVDVGTGTLAVVMALRRSRSTAVAWSPDGTRLLVGDHTGAVWVGDADRFEPRGLGRHASAVRSVAWSRDGDTAVSAGEDGTVRTWSAATGAPRQHLAVGSGVVRAVRRSPAADVVLAVADGDVWLWPLHPGATADLVALAHARATRPLSARERDAFGLPGARR